MHVLKFKVRIKVVVQSPLALVPPLHVLSDSQTEAMDLQLRKTNPQL